MPPVPDALWTLVEPLLPDLADEVVAPGRLPVPDRRALSGIVFVLGADIAWSALSPVLGYGSGMACWRRREAWFAAGAWSAIEEAVVGYLELHGREAEAAAIRRRGQPEATGDAAPAVGGVRAWRTATPIPARAPAAVSPGPVARTRGSSAARTRAPRTGRGTAG